MIQFGVGYWTVNMIADQLATEDVILTKNKHNNTCRIYHGTHDIFLGTFGTLLGFQDYTAVPGGVYKDSGRVNINRWLQYVTIGCDAVNTFKNFDRYGLRSNIIATFPVTTEQSLNNTVTYHKDVNFEAALNNGTLNAFTFYVNTNIKQEVRLYILMVVL